MTSYVLSPLCLQLSGDIVTNLQYQIDQLKVSSKIAELYGLNGTLTPNDVFNNIWYRIRMIMLNKALFVLRLQLSDGSPLEGFSISGITNEDGTTAVADENGTITGFVAEGTRTLSFSGYADLSTYSKSYTFVKGESYSDQWTLSAINFVSYASTVTIKFSSRVKRIAYSVVGGGGGGASGSNGSGGGGGGGGYANKGELIPAPDKSYSVSVGSGGTYGSGGGGPGQSNSYLNGNNGTSGGTSSFNGTYAYGGGGGVTAGSGGSGNGSGGTGAISRGATGSTRPSVVTTEAGSGGSSTSTYYSSLTEESACGGGGGGGGSSMSILNNYGSDYGYSNPGYAGSPNGGTGGSGSSYSGTGTSGKGIGGGGGGGGGYYMAEDHEDYSQMEYASHSGGSGSRGIVTLRIYTN